MKTLTNKYSKRVLSIALAIAMLVGTVFTANVGVNLTANAETETETGVIYWDANASRTAPTQTDGDTIIINTVAELAYITSSETDTAGKTYKIADGIKTLVLQPESSVSLETLKSLKTYSETKSYFEGSEVTNLKNWNIDTSKYFKGTIDFNGATIYGLYQKDTYFAGLISYLSEGATIKNVAIKNAYTVATDSAGVLAARTIANAASGNVTITNCEISGSYVASAFSPADDLCNRAGVLYGFNVYSTQNLGTIMSNLYVHNNKAEKTDGSKTFGLFGCAANYYNGVDNKPDYPNSKLTNSIVLDTVPYSVYKNNQALRPQLYTNVYVNTVDSDFSDLSTHITKKDDIVNTTNIIDISSNLDNYKGAKAILNLSTFNFATDTTDGDWYAIEGGYPTPIKPDGWKDVDHIITWNGSSADITDGDGSKENPYVIKTAEQLYKMVIDGGKVDGVAKYYKVADNVTELYLNYVTTKDEIVSLVNSGSYKAWNNNATTFDGYFDGNGATIYGLASVNATRPGFVGEIGLNAQICNVNFAAAYVLGNSAAVISTKCTTFDGDIEAYSYVKNTTVRQSYIKSTNTSTSGGAAVAAGFVATSDTPDCLTFINCLYDGSTCTLVNGSNSSDYTQSSIGGIAAFPNWGNNIKFKNCVSIGAYLVPMVTSMATGSKTSSTKDDVTTYSYTWYERYTNDSNQNSPGIIEFVNCYSPVNPVMYSEVYDQVTFDSNGNATQTITRIYDKITEGITPVEIQENKKYDETVLASLDYLNTWQLVEFADGTTLPMPIKSTEVESLDNIIATAQNGRGANNGRPYDDGTYGMYHEFAGSGTAADPYIIDSAEKLAYAIGCGGVNLKDTLNYKLVCDIDLTGKSWITKKGVKYLYTYVSFKGVLDGNGHTITGLTSTEMNGAGLVPVLDGGTVKNLKIVGSYIGSDSISSKGDVQTTVVAGAVAGTATENGGTVQNCSVIDTAVNSGKNTANKVAGDGITATNCTYITKTTNTETNTNTSSYVTTYVGVDGDTPVADYNGKNAATATWYCGGAEGSQPQLVVNATTTETVYNKDGSINRVDTYVDIDGDGVSTVYGGNDLTAMRYKLSRKKGYTNVYGDVNQDGTVDIRDIVALKRTMTTDYSDLEDGFWRNVALGKVGIYYAENDTYDMARSLELYLEQSVPGIDVIKYAGPAVYESITTNRYQEGKLPTKNAVILECTNSGTANATTDKNFTVTFNNKTNLVKISGGSFTAVEAAVNKFMSESNAIKNTVYAGSGTLSDTYASKTVNGTTYYYAWGDEFDTGDTYSSDTWSIMEYKSKTVDKDGNETGRYINKVNPNVSDLKDLYVVNDGKLTIWRGVNADATTKSESTYNWGYKTLHLGNNDTYNDFKQKVDDTDVYVDAGAIHTTSSMLFKQGYIEMKATLPSDGHAFPAWWFLTSSAHRNNNYYDATLYSKVYKLNNAWNGTNKMLANDLKTYKYQLPTAHLEYDVLELMQYDEVTEGNWLTEAFLKEKDVTLTGAYITKLHLTVHKIYDENSLNGKLYIPNWSTGTSTEWTETFKTTGGGDFVHKYFADNGTFTYDFGNTSTLKNEHVFGFEWKVNQTVGTYSIDVYVDGTKRMSISQKDGHNPTEYGTDPTHTSGGDDAAIWNQYAFMLLDNSFYSSSESTTYRRSNISDKWVGDGKPSQFTDLLTQESGDTAQFTIDYVRVYQQDNMRDIVTPETEAFNTGNHFGYGVK